MDILTSGITGAFFAVIMVLAKVIEYLIKKRGESKESTPPMAKDYNGNGITYKLETIKDKVEDARVESRNASEAVNEMRSDMKSTNERLCDKVEHLAQQVEKLESLPAQMGRLSDAIDGLKEEIKNLQ